MTQFCRRLKSLLPFGPVFAAFSLLSASGGVYAATPVTPYALFQFGTLTASGNTITASWVPVVNSSGQTIYENITLEFEVASNGVLTVMPGYPLVIQTPPPGVTAFKAGKYVAPSTFWSGAGFINISGPGVAAGGATEWSLATATGANSGTYPKTATFYVGSIASNPLAARISKAGITSTAWSYGIGGDCGCGAGNGGWYGNSLLGFSQTGNALTIVSFTDESGVDHNVPVDQMTYTLSQ